MRISFPWKLQTLHTLHDLFAHVSEMARVCRARIVDSDFPRQGIPPSPPARVRVRQLSSCKTAAGHRILHATYQSDKRQFAEKARMVCCAPHLRGPLPLASTGATFFRHPMVGSRTRRTMGGRETVPSPGRQRNVGHIL